VNIIHSSSRAYNPVGNSNPGTGSANRFAAKTGQTTAPIREVQANDRQGQSSTPEQIQYALSTVQGSKTEFDNQSNLTQKQKALNAYTDTMNLAARTRVTEAISGIDLYA
jgi:Lon protease-like protein